MKRVLAIWLPSWLGQHGKPRCVPASPPSPTLPAEGREPEENTLVALAQWCHRFSPSVGVEEGEAPETILLDATNLAPLYGGEAALVDEVTRGLRRRGLEARVAIADTVGAAWALARYGGASLEVLPIAALRLPEAMLATLGELGLACVGDVLGLDREQLRSRFGPLLLLRVDQLTGAAREVFAAVDPPEEFAVEQAFEHPLARGDAIRYAVSQLLERLAWLLAARQAGALEAACRISCEGAPAVQFHFGLFQPTASATHLLEIADMQLERLRLAAPATAIELRVVRHAPLAERQGALFDEPCTLESSRPLAGLVDRLAGRLGREAVVRCRLVSDAQPELAYREEVLVGRGKAEGGRRKGRRLAYGALDRPLRLLGVPAALEMASVFPEGPPILFHYGGQRHDVARFWGTERIETGWWRRMQAARDYYRVETNEGRRFWLFRRRRDGRWFLHGEFG